MACSRSGRRVPLFWRRRAPARRSGRRLRRLRARRRRLRHRRQRQLAVRRAAARRPTRAAPTRAAATRRIAAGADRRASSSRWRVSIGEDVVGDFLFIGGILFAVWGAATVVRSRQELAGALAARTVELEHEREENAKLAVAEERARIARELHDVVAHNLSIMVVQAGAERRAIGDERPETARGPRDDRADRPHGDGRDAPAARRCCAAPTTSWRSRRSRACATSTSSSARSATRGCRSTCGSRASRARSPPASTCRPTGSSRRR